MKLTRLSFTYLIGYLIPSGALLLLAPDLTLRLLGSSGSYGDVMPRVVGGALLALGLLIVQIVRLRVEALYATTVGVRGLLVVVLAWLFARSADPFLAIVAGVVLVGMALTTTGYLLDARRAGAVSARPL